MTAFEEVMKELKDIRNHYDTGFTVLERQRIIELYARICGKTIQNPSCSDCYRDAFIEVFSTLQRTGALPEERHYKLKKNKCLHIFGTNEYLFDVSDKQAEKFLSQYPSAIDDFEEFPQDWEERVNARKERYANRYKNSVRRAAKKAVEEANNESE